MSDLYDKTIKSLINADGISDEQRNQIRTQHDLTKLKKRPHSPFKINQKEGQVKRKISSLENDINIWKTNIDGTEWEQQSFPYQAKCLKWINDEFSALNEDDQKQITSFLEKTGCENLIVRSKND